MRELTGKQQAFIDYIEDSTNKVTFSNGLESARAAGYKGNNDTLKSVACENLTKPYIKQAIEAKRAERQEKTDRTVESLDVMYQSAYDLAKTIKAPAAMNQAVTGIARLYSMDQPGSSDAPKPIPAEDLDLLKAIAKAVTEKELAKPKLARSIAQKG